MPTVTPQIKYLDKLLEELKNGNLRIPCFQRPFEWSPEQMVKLLESVMKPYPIGSLLIWEPEQGKNYRSLNQIGPHEVPPWPDGPRGPSFLLDGHRRMSTLAGTLLPPAKTVPELQQRRWTIYYDLNDRSMKRMTTDDLRRKKSSSQEFLTWIPVYSLLDGIKVHEKVTEILTHFGTQNQKATDMVNHLREVSTVFQRYAIPVNVVQHANLEEAVQIFSLMNTTGKKVSPDRVFTALTYEEESPNVATTYDSWLAEDGMIGKLGFQTLARAVLYRATLAALNRPIYDNPWAALNAVKARQKDTGANPEAFMDELGRSLTSAITFLKTELYIRHPSVLPYSLQLIQLAEFFRVLGDAEPSPTQRDTMRRGIWSAALSGEFNLGSSRRFSDAIERSRDIARGKSTDLLGRDALAWPLPEKFNPNSARARVFFLFLASRAVDPVTGELWKDALVHGLNDTAPVFSRENRFERDKLENRVLCPRDRRATLLTTLKNLKNESGEKRQKILDGLVISEDAWSALQNGDQEEFWKVRRQHLIVEENRHIENMGIKPAQLDESAIDENDSDAEDELDVDE